MSITGQKPDGRKRTADAGTDAGESERHYERLVEAPFVYGQTLSGNVTLDAVVADYTKRAQERTLLFDAVVEPVHISDMAELDVTVSPMRC